MMSGTPFPAVEWPAWAQMWSIALAIYMGCKWVTWQHAAVHNVPAWKQCAYLLAWPGMDAATFLGEGRGAGRLGCCRREWIAATANLLIGMTLLFGIAAVIPPQPEYL